LKDVARGLARGRIGAILSWALVCLLLAITQISIAGYTFGVGNQAIQVPMLERAGNGTLFARDAMLTSTAGEYPSFFFRLLAPAARRIGTEPLYAGLHLLTAACVFASMIALGRALFGSRAAGVVAALLLVGGQHDALAGDGLYSAGFTHTFAVFPIAIAALALAFRKRFAAAMLVAGVLFNFHALTAAYLVILLIAGWVGGQGLRRALRRKWSLAIGVALFVLAALPTLFAMLAHRQSFDAAWIALTEIRSADHSFPSTWWQVGSASVPRFALLIGIGAVAMGFRAPPIRRRQWLAMLGAAAGLGVIGIVFADVWPVPTILRAQLFRCSRLVLVLLFAQIAYAALCGLSQGRRGWRGWLEVATALLTLAVVGIPSLLPILPIAFLAGAVVAIVIGRLSLPAALIAAAVSFITIAAAADLGFPLIAGPSSTVGGHHPVVALLALTTVAAYGVLRWWRPPNLFAWIGRGVVVASAVALAIAAWPRATEDPWILVQRWAAANTPPDALFLTAAQPGGFRVRSHRAVVGEWRDGTQLYFSAAFAPTWWSRMLDLQPGLLTDASGKHLLTRGAPLDSLEDEALVAMANKYGATHIVLPAGRKRTLPVLYSNANFVICRPVLPLAEAPPGTPDKDRWRADDKFMRETVLPNIEKYRKGDARLQLLDATGRPLVGATVSVRQTRQSFSFSASLPFFAETPPAPRDYRPPVVQQPELDRFLEVFNFSMIPFSGKWMYIEPTEGTRLYDDLDKYVDWCTTHGVRMEYHFLSGYSAPWLAKKPRDQQQAAFIAHATDLAKRYGDKIEAWQVCNERVLIEQSPQVFAELRKIIPNAKLGISDCAKFDSENRSARTKELRDKDMLRGLADIKWLKEQGIQLDFFAIHGHRPFGMWAEAKQMYDTLDAFAREGVRLHVSELSVPEDVKIGGFIRGGMMTSQAQAEFYARFFTICYSHPAVDMVNLWGIGPNTWQPRGGLLNADYSPKPAYVALKKLITETWRTNVTLRTGIDGACSFRGFHGDYEATVTHPDGHTSILKFSIAPPTGKPDDKSTDKPTLVRRQLNAGNVFVPMAGP
jgi:GH35 family endo-1,4-beta-xylanase